MKVELKYIVPNSITVFNLLSGIIAIVLILEGQIMTPVFLILAAAVFDFLDGFAAKLLHATSAFGKQMDSLADVVSFGLAPATLLFKLMGANFDSTTLMLDESSAPSIETTIILYSSFIFTIAAALRLARFNIDDKPTVDFKGLPVPAAALCVVAIWLAAYTSENIFIQNYFHSTLVLLTINLFISFLMVSEIPMISLKFTNMKPKENLWKYALILGSIVLFSIGRMDSILVIMVYYILLSFSKAIFSR